MLGEAAIFGEQKCSGWSSCQRSRKYSEGAVATEEHKMLQWYCLPNRESQSEKVGASASSEKVMV